jgi:hypothetical protein
MESNLTSEHSRAHAIARKEPEAITRLIFIVPARPEPGLPGGGKVKYQNSDCIPGDHKIDIS